MKRTNEQINARKCETPGRARSDGYRLLAILTALLLLASCKTYYITLDSFKQQFEGIDSAKLKPVVMTGGGFANENYLANPIQEIRCTDKDGNPHLLRNGPAIEARFTYSNGAKKKRTIFFFDRVFVTDKSVIGIRSRIMGLRKTIPLDSIRKIEVQNGGKKYYYKND